MALSEYESQGLAIQKALAVGCPLVVANNSALKDLNEHANVRMVSRQATNGDIAAAIVELLDAPRVTPPPPLSTWDQCASALLEVRDVRLSSPRSTTT